MGLIKSFIVVILCAAISSCTNTGEQKDTVQELQTQELSVSKIDTIPEIIPPLFDSCIIYFYTYLGGVIVVNQDTIFIRDFYPNRIDYPISLDKKNLITECINKLYIEKSVPEIQEKKKYNPEYYEEMERACFYEYDIYSKGKKEHIEVFDEVYRGNDTIIHSPEYDRLIGSIRDILHDYRDERGYYNIWQMDENPQQHDSYD